ncbi:MAG: hypothetical protein ABI359_02670 [Ginsengibacter sp.]
MIYYSNYHEAVIDLHERGFSEDFVLFGNDLLWVQEKSFVTPEDFSIIECHRVDFPKENMEELVIFGVMTFCRNIKGILMNHYSFSSSIPGVIIDKLKKMHFY